MTHAHTDHILGVIWMIRVVAQAIQKGEYEGKLRVYGHEKVVKVLDWICRMTLPKKIVARLGEDILLCEVETGGCFQAIGLEMECFDIASTKENSLVSGLRCPTDSRWSAWAMNPTMNVTVTMWKEPTGCCVRLSACMKTGSVSNLTKSITARRSMLDGWLPSLA